MLIQLIEMPLLNKSFLKERWFCVTIFAFSVTVTSKVLSSQHGNAKKSQANSSWGENVLVYFGVTICLSFKFCWKMEQILQVDERFRPLSIPSLNWNTGVHVQLWLCLEQ